MKISASCLHKMLWLEMNFNLELTKPQLVGSYIARINQQMPIRLQEQVLRKILSLCQLRAGKYPKTEHSAAFCSDQYIQR